MIVNPTPTGWQIIHQQAHALLAAQLAWAWPPFLPPDRWVGLLAAIGAARRRAGRLARPRRPPRPHARRGPGQLHATGFFAGAGAPDVLHAARFQGQLAQPAYQPAPELRCTSRCAAQQPGIDGLLGRAEGPASARWGQGPGHHAKAEARQRLRPAALVPTASRSSSAGRSCPSWAARSKSAPLPRRPPGPRQLRAPARRARARRPRCGPGPSPPKSWQ
ncbi:MAG: DUF3891 family protein [Hymenobacter sp.]